MALLPRLLKHMERIAPQSLAQTSWDNVGLLVEAPFPRVRSTPNTPQKVFLTIDFTTAVVEEALSDPDVGAIVVYHPPIFRALKKLQLKDSKSRMVLQCAAKGVSVYSPHTSCDCCEDGVNDWLVQGFGKEGTIKTFEPVQNPPEGHPNAGMGRVFTFNEPKPVQQVIEQIKKHLGMTHVRAAIHPSHQSGQQLISTVGVWAGSGSGILAHEADLYLTGEMGHHEVLEALEQKRTVVLCEHSNTERGYLKASLKPKLEQLFAQDGGEAVEVVVSKTDKDPLRRDQTMMHAGESRIPVLKTRRATGESIYRPTPRSTPPNSTRPRANTGAAPVDNRKYGVHSPPLTPNPPLPSSGSLAVPKPNAGSRISDLISDPNFNPFKPSTPPTFSPSFESSLDILGGRPSNTKANNRSPPLPSPSESPESSPSATLSGGTFGREKGNTQEPVSSNSRSAWTRDTSTASPESTSSATMNDDGVVGRDESANFQKTEHGRDGSVSSTTIPRLNHDDMILPVVAKRLKAEGLHVHNVVAIGEGEDAPLYRIRDPAGSGGALYDRLKGMSSTNVAKQASSNSDTSIPSSPEPSLPSPPLPAQQGKPSQPAESPGVGDMDRESPEPTSPVSPRHQQQQQLPSPTPSPQEIQSPTRPPKAHRPPRHTATMALAEQVRQEEIALQDRRGTRMSGQGQRDNRNMEFLQDGMGGAGYEAQTQHWDHSASSSSYNNNQSNDSFAYGNDGPNRPARTQPQRWNNYEPPVPVPSRRPGQQSHPAYHQQPSQQDHSGASYSPYDHQQYPSSYQDPQQGRQYQQPQQRQQYYQQQQAYQGRQHQSTTPQMQSSNYYPQQTPAHSSIDMPMKPEQQQQQQGQDGQRMSLDNNAPAPKKKKNALCCIIC
ncbi:NGG1 interacting factor [Actinomortierella wolfii]|nr:NGG1 interacting factor [Actinomortierella wolfii]